MTVGRKKLSFNRKIPPAELGSRRLGEEAMTKDKRTRIIFSIFLALEVMQTRWRGEGKSG